MTRYIEVATSEEAEVVADAFRMKAELTFQEASQHPLVHQAGGEVRARLQQEAGHWHRLAVHATRTAEQLALEEGDHDRIAAKLAADLAAILPGRGAVEGHQPDEEPPMR